MKQTSRQVAAQDAAEAKRMRKAEYMRKYHAKKRKAAAAPEPQKAVDAEAKPEQVDEASRERVYGPVIEALNVEKEAMLARHRVEVEEITQGIAVLTRLSKRELKSALTRKQ